MLHRWHTYFLKGKTNGHVLEKREDLVNRIIKRNETWIHQSTHKSEIIKNDLENRVRANWKSKNWIVCQESDCYNSLGH